MNEPEWFGARLEPLPRGVKLFERATEPLDVIIYFSDTLSNVERRIPLLAGYLTESGTLWMAYPTGLPGAPTDVTPEGVERIAAAAGLLGRGAIPIAEGWTAIALAPRAGGAPRPLSAR